MTGRSLTLLTTIIGCLCFCNGFFADVPLRTQRRKKASATRWSENVQQEGWRKERQEDTIASCLTVAHENKHTQRRRRSGESRERTRNRQTLIVWRSFINPPSRTSEERFEHQSPFIMLRFHKILVVAAALWWTTAGAFQTTTPAAIKVKRISSSSSGGRGLRYTSSSFSSRLFNAAQKQDSNDDDDDRVVALLEEDQQDQNQREDAQQQPPPRRDHDVESVVELSIDWIERLRSDSAAAPETVVVPPQQDADSGAADASGLLWRGVVVVLCALWASNFPPSSWSLPSRVRVIICLFGRVAL